MVAAVAAVVCHPEMGPGKVSHLVGLAGMPERVSSGHQDTEQEEKGYHHPDATAWRSKSATNVAKTATTGPPS